MNAAYFGELAASDYCSITGNIWVIHTFDDIRGSNWELIATRKFLEVCLRL